MYAKRGFLSKSSQHNSYSLWFRIISWLLVILWAGVIFFMSSRTDTGLTEDMNIISMAIEWLKAQQLALFGDGVDILMPFAHFCEYMVFGALLVNSLRLHMPLGRAMLVAVVLASVYGVTDEIHQHFVPGRVCDPLDWLVDTIGAGVGSGISLLVLRNRKRVE
jgi:VanZ family protein